MRALHLASIADRAVVAAATGRRGPKDLAEGLLGPVTPLRALPALAVALRSTVRWKSREHPVRPAWGAPGEGSAGPPGA